jgi:predicted thioesterase
MRQPFQPGDVKEHQYIVKPEDLAAFGERMIHPVCSTFALGREMEWSSRQFVLEMIEPDEEGVGTFLEISHHSPAVEGEHLLIKATLIEVIDHAINCKLRLRWAIG